MTENGKGWFVPEFMRGRSEKGLHVRCEVRVQPPRRSGLRLACSSDVLVFNMPFECIILVVVHGLQESSANIGEFANLKWNPLNQVSIENFLIQIEPPTTLRGSTQWATWWSQFKGVWPCTFCLRCEISRFPGSSVEM